MLIDPKGLLHGERIGACSDEAQLHFPRLLSASNSFGRFRMSVKWLQDEVYGSFHQKPTHAQLTLWLREFHENFLLFVYRAPDNSVWAQWEIPEKLLGRYRLSADKRSPAPPEAELTAYRRSYIERLRAKNAECPDDLSESFQNIPEVSENFRKVSHDVGVGVGVGVGVVFASPSAPPVPSPPEKPAHEPHPLFTNCRLAILAYWDKWVQPNAEPTWDGSEAKALSELLKATPSLTIARFKLMLEHRGQSDVNPCERPRKWIASLPNYELGPLDAFGKPRTRRKPPGGPQGVPKATQALGSLDEAKEQALSDWRDVRDRGDPEYEKAPGWVRQVLDGGEEQQRAVA